MAANQRTSSVLDQPGRMFSVVPIELLRMISEQLPPPSQIALALSCKGFYACIYPSRKLPKLSKSEQTELLLSLEKDIPGHFWCYLCNRFCVLEPGKFFGRAPRQSHECYFGLCLQERRFKERLHLRSMSCLGLNFFDAHAIMNGHLYGEQHGMPISVLTRSENHEVYVPPILRETWDSARAQSPWPDWIRRPLYSTPTIPDCQFLPRKYWATQREEGFHFTRQFQQDTGFDSVQSMTPWKIIRCVGGRIIGDELYLRVFHSISGPLGTEKLLPAFLIRINISLCGHITFYGKSHSNRAPSTKRAAFNSFCGRDKLLRPLRRVRNKVVSCAHCNSDGCFSLVDNKETQKWVMQFTSYHCLGRCEKPDDYAWRVLVGRPRTPPLRRLVNTPDGPYNAGMIRRRWNDSLGTLPEKVTVKWSSH